MSVIETLVAEARTLGATFVIRGDKVKVAAPTPLPSELVFRLRQHREELVEFLHSDFEPSMLREWRRLSTPEWRDILVKSIKAQDSIRESYARWMLQEVLLDPEYQEPTR